MKYLVLFLLLTACAQPKIPNLPSTELDPKYFKRDKLYPYIYLKDGDLEYIPAGGLDYRTRKPLPPINSPYWGEAEAFTNEYEQISIRVPIEFKNTGKVLAYTNSSGGIFLNEEEILVEPEELTALINKYPVFFEHYPYEETLFAYTNFAANFTKDFTNILQVFTEITKRHENYVEWRKIQDSLENFTLEEWEEAFHNFQFYIIPQLSLRSLDIVKADVAYHNFFVRATEIDFDDSQLQDYVSTYSFLSSDNIHKFQISALNLMILNLYFSLSQDNSKIPTLYFHSFMRDEYRYTLDSGLLDGWPRIELGKHF